MGVNPNMSTAENPTRPHLLAAYRGHHQVKRMEVNPNTSTAENPTRPHLLAAYRGHHQVKRMEVNPNMSTAQNHTRPHLLAAYRGHHQVQRQESTQTCQQLSTRLGLNSWPPTGATTRYSDGGQPKHVHR